jgi:hypothetical protein
MCGVVLLQMAPWTVLATIALIAVPAALFWSQSRILRLLVRTRWLFLSIALLFLFAVPGERLAGLAGDMGMTVEGLSMAAEHLLRLLLLLATLALLHERLGNHGLVTGLHWLLAPLANWRTLRERIVVRLILVLDYVEGTPAPDWREWLSPELAPGLAPLALETRAAGFWDWLVLGAFGVVLVVGWQLL